MLDLTAAFATFPVLETERLILRAITADDAETMFRIMADERVLRYFGSLPMKTIDEAEQRAERIATAFNEGSGIRWAITERASGRFMGTGGFWRIVKEHFRAEIGYELAPDFWGQGVMPEALGAILDWGFTTMGLHSVEAQIDPANNGSRRVLEKCGFVQEGYFRENYYLEGVFTDTAVFSLIHADWKKRSQQ